EKIVQPLHELPLAVVTIESELCDQRVGQRELGNGKAGNCKLAQAEQSNPKLRNGYDPNGNLSHGNNTLGRHRQRPRVPARPAGAILERDMHYWQSEQTPL